MRLLGKHFDKDGCGHVTLIPEDAEDMWHAYNLIQPNDLLKSSTVRKVTSESSTGSTSSQRVHTVLKVAVESVDYDVASGALHVKGRNTEENPHVKMGAYHTLDLELNRKFTLQKQCWDSMFIERVENACDPTLKADVAAVVMQEGLAHVCLITANMTLVRAKIDVNIPKKRKGNSAQHDKSVSRFYENVAQALLRHVDFDIVKCVLIASPGFVREQFYDFLLQLALKDGNKTLIDNKPKFLLVHSSSGFKHSLKEVLADPLVMNKLSDTKAAGEVRALENFFELLQTEPDRAFYGKDHVERACQAQAIDTLLVSDKILRPADLAERKRIVSLVERVKESGATVRLFSSLHVSGEQLDQLGGLAAMLRFPMPEIEEEDQLRDEQTPDPNHNDAHS